MEIVKRQPQHLKRVVVMTAGEGEKAPAGTVEKNGKHYLAEYFFVPKPKFDPRKKGDGRGRFGKGGGKFNKKFNKKRPDGKPSEQRPDGANARPDRAGGGRPDRAAGGRPGGDARPNKGDRPNRDGKPGGRDGKPFRPRNPNNPSSQKNNRFPSPTTKPAEAQKLEIQATESTAKIESSETASKQPV